MSGPRLSLALGRPRQGLNILDEDRTGSHAGRSAADEALRAALRAALGDHDAYAWLRSQVVRDTGSAPIGYLRWLLAVAAEAAGDRPAADELWVSLVERSHLLTWHSTARYTLVSGWERGAHRDFFHVPLASIGKQARSGTVGPKRTTTMRATGPSAAIGDLTERARSQD